jgi:phosphoglycolate phosphatase-like HAD superfamily hydrolase
MSTSHSTSSCSTSTSLSSYKRLHLVLDFDGTLTTSDTLAHVASIGYTETHSHSPKPGLKPWSEIVSAYLSNLKAHTDAYPTPPSQRTTLAAEVAWLNSLLPIEQASAERALDAGIWDNVNAGHVIWTAREAFRNNELALRPGWNDLVTWVISLSPDVGFQEGKLSILSVNWSRWWVFCALGSAVEFELGLGHDPIELALTKVCTVANELPGIASFVKSMAKASKNYRGKAVEMRTSGDKLKFLRELRRHDDELMVYVGDSTTDLECLVDADIGICVRDEIMGSSQRELAETLKRLDIKVTRLSEASTDERLDRGLFWVKDFTEVQTFLKGLQIGERH